VFYIEHNDLVSTSHNVYHKIASLCLLALTPFTLRNKPRGKGEGWAETTYYDNDGLRWNLLFRKRVHFSLVLAIFRILLNIFHLKYMDNFPELYIVRLRLSFFYLSTKFPMKHNCSFLMTSMGTANSVTWRNCRQNSCTKRNTKLSPIIVFLLFRNMFRSQPRI
jgi:hypothetical protein